MKIFVYGSLREGFYNYKKYLQGKVIEISSGKTKGRLYEIADKNYPAMLLEEGEVLGEIMTVKGIDLEEMDEMENFFGTGNLENEYNRIPREVLNTSTGETEILDIYVFNDKNPDFSRDKLKYIPHGDWKKFCCESGKDCGKID